MAIFFFKEQVIRLDRSHSLLEGLVPYPVQVRHAVFEGGADQWRGGTEIGDQSMRGDVQCEHRRLAVLQNSQLGLRDIKYTFLVAGSLA